jgi:hypothetical protein
MTNQWQGRGTFVNRLRVRGHCPDPTLARLRLETLLSGAQLSPSELAPSAILCVRRLRGPAPGSLASSAAAAGAMLPHDWERAVAARLGELARSAARPAQGAVPASAEAILFTDQAELLACLASDCCDGSLAAHWWWQTLFRGANTTPVRAMLDAPTCIPAALEHLARRGKVLAFARTLGTGEARALLLSIVRVFALPQLQAALDVDVAARRAAAGAEAEGARVAFLPGAREAAKTLEDWTAQHAPWRQAVPEADDFLAPEQQILLGVGLMLMRAPTIVRTQTFASATQRWLVNNAAASIDGVSAAPATLPPADQASAASRPGRPATMDAEQAESNAATLFVEPAASGVATEAGPGAVIEAIEATGVELADGPQDSPVKATADAQVSAGIANSSTSHETESEVESSASSLAEDGYDERQAATQLSEESATLFGAADAQAAETMDAQVSYVETQLGGIFYLLNLALFLGLYGDFTSPAAPGIPLSPWDFLALAGKELAGDKFHDDPVWKLLARLAGRSETQAPGEGFTPPDEWRMPSSWLEPFAGHVELRWTARDGRLRVHHPEGFLLFDVPSKREEARARLTREMKAYRNHISFELRREKAPHWSNDVAETDGLKRWLGWLMPYARARLRRALGLAGAGDLSKLLCERRARVLASATHVDLFFTLAELPIEVRLSGIDRDPGWIPAAGRFIAFHYE